MKRWQVYEDNSCTLLCKASWYSWCGNQNVDRLELKAELSLCWMSLQIKWNQYLKNIYSHLCSFSFSHNNQSDTETTDERRCGMYTQWGIIPLWRKMKACGTSGARTWKISCWGRGKPDLERQIPHDAQNQVEINKMWHTFSFFFQSV